MGSFMSFFLAAIWGVALIGVIASAIFTKDSLSVGIFWNALIHFTAAGLIGWGIVKKFKAAPVAGLIVSVIALIENLVSNGFIHIDTVLYLSMAWMFLLSARGIFEHHKITSD